MRNHLPSHARRLRLLPALVAVAARGAVVEHPSSGGAHVHERGHDNLGSGQLGRPHGDAGALDLEILGPDAMEGQVPTP